MKPIFKIIADDKNITDILSPRLISINITDETGLLSDGVEILLDNRNDILEIPTRGTNLEIYLGYQDQALSLMGNYVVDNIYLSCPPSKMRIIAKAHYLQTQGLANNIRSPKNRSWHQHSLVGIITKIANEHQLKALIDESFEKRYLAHIDQTNESDLSFLTNLAQNNDAIIKFISGNLIFAKKNKGTSITGKELPTITISKGDIANWQLNILDRGKFGKVIARYHNFATGKEESTSAGNNEPVYEMRYSFTDQATANEAAKAKLDQLQRGVSKLELSLIGNSNLNSESKLIIEDIRYLKDKTWIIDSANHELSDQGYVSRITALEKI